MKYGVNRRRQDEFSLHSHQMAAQASDSGAFAAEIIPTWGRDQSGKKVQLTRDQGIRADTSLDALSALPPAFNPAGGSITAGNSSQVSTARRLLVMSEDKAKNWLKPLADQGDGVAGVDPCDDRPVPAINKALGRAGLKLADIDCIEINEAFAVQVLSVLKLLGINEEVNTRGGGRPGHPGR
jgi:acetyl-CoA acyltransferase